MGAKLMLCAGTVESLQRFTGNRAGQTPCSSMEGIFDQMERTGTLSTDVLSEDMAERDGFYYRRFAILL